MSFSSSLEAVSMRVIRHQAGVTDMSISWQSSSRFTGYIRHHMLRAKAKLDLATENICYLERRKNKLRRC